MIEISKQEMEYLIEKGFLKTHKGKYKDLIITGRKKKSRNKKRYVPEHIASELPMTKVTSVLGLTIKKINK